MLMTPNHSRTSPTAPGKSRGHVSLLSLLLLLLLYFFFFLLSRPTHRFEFPFPAIFLPRNDATNASSRYLLCNEGPRDNSVGFLYTRTSVASVCRVTAEFVAVQRCANTQHLIDVIDVMQIECSLTRAAIFLRRQTRAAARIVSETIAPPHNHDICHCLPDRIDKPATCRSVWRFDPSKRLLSARKNARTLLCRNSRGKGHCILQLVFHELMHEEETAHRETPLVPKVGHALHLSPPCVYVHESFSYVTSPRLRHLVRDRARLRVEIARARRPEC